MELMGKRLSMSVQVHPGQWLRDQVQAKETSVLGKYIHHNWNHGTLEPIVTEYVESEVRACLEVVQDVCVDGFPRTEKEALKLPAISRGHPALVIELLLDSDQMVERSIKRQRIGDDTETSRNIRLESYNRNMSTVRPILQTFGIYRSVNAQQSIEEVFADLSKILEDQGQYSRMVIPPTDGRSFHSSLLSPATAIESAEAVQTSLALARSPKLHKQFCGSHPISLDRDNMFRIRRFPYMVSLKADGFRYLCVVRRNHLWFINRKLEVWKSKYMKELQQWNNTLLDGEMVTDNLFLVLDCLNVRGAHCMADPLIERLRKSVQLGSLFANGPLYFRAQEYCDRTMLSQLMLREKELPYKVDGIIFTPSRLPVRLGTDWNMFKWKPFKNNTIDALYCKGYLFCRKKGETSMALENMAYIGDVLEQDRPEWLVDRMIVECRPLSITRSSNDVKIRWRPTKERKDKPFPNMDWVADNVIKSIKDNITKEDILHECSLPGLKRSPPGRTSRLGRKW
jgi:mRNA guanylyltransferase